MINYDTATTYPKNNMGNIAAKEINVVIHTPSNLHEHIKQQKVNKIYDILNHKTNCKTSN